MIEDREIVEGTAVDLVNGSVHVPDVDFLDPKVEGEGVLAVKLEEDGTMFVLYGMFDAAGKHQMVWYRPGYDLPGAAKGGKAPLKSVN